MHVYVLAAHIRGLARLHRIRVTYHERGEDCAWRNLRRIHIRPVRSDVTYAIALHELGHVAGQQRGNVLAREAQAWAWAKRHALHWTARMADVETRCMTSYQAWVAECESRSR